MYLCLGTNNKTLVHGSMSIIETTCLTGLKKSHEFQSTSLNNRDCKLVWRIWQLDISFPETRAPFLVFSWLEFLWSVSYICGKGSYIWEGVRNLILWLFSLAKNRILLKPWQLCLVMEKNLQQENKAFIPIIYYALVICILCPSF